MSASSAVSVRRGSTTMSVRPSSAAICFSVTRAWGMECECQGFFPRNIATSQCSKSDRMAGTPNIRSVTQNSPVFSWASALERQRDPSARRVPVL